MNAFQDTDLDYVRPAFAATRSASLAVAISLAIGAATVVAVIAGWLQ